MSLFIILIILLISISISTSISKSKGNTSRRSNSNTSDKSKHQENNSESIQGEPIEPIEITDAPKVVAKDIDSSKMVEAPKTSQELVIYQPTLKPFSSKQTMFYDFRRKIEDILRSSERISLNPDNNQEYQNCIDSYQIIHPHVDNYIIQGYCYYKFTTLDVPMKRMIDWSKNIFLVYQSMYNAGMTIEQIRPYLYHYKPILPELKSILKAKSSSISGKKIEEVFGSTSSSVEAEDQSNSNTEEKSGQSSSSASIIQSSRNPDHNQGMSSFYYKTQPKDSHPFEHLYHSTEASMKTPENLIGMAIRSGLSPGDAQSYHRGNEEKRRQLVEDWNDIIRNRENSQLVSNTKKNKYNPLSGALGIGVYLDGCCSFQKERVVGTESTKYFSQFLRIVST